MPPSKLLKYNWQYRFLGFPLSGKFRVLFRILNAQALKFHRVFDRRIEHRSDANSKNSQPGKIKLSVFQKLGRDFPLCALNDVSRFLYQPPTSPQIEGR